MKNFLNKVFKLDENNSTVKCEVVSGLTTFFAMCYIIVLNPNQMTGFNNYPEIWNACFVGGIIAAVVATLLMAFIANKPFALAAGMGLNSFFFVSFILPAVLDPSLDALNGYKAGLAVVLLSGVIFLILSVTGLRKYIATSLPPVLKTAIPVGIGMFIAFIGLQNCGLVIPNEYTGVSICDFTKGASVIVPAVVGLVGFILIVIFSSSNVKFLKGGSIILGIIASTILYYILVLCCGLDVSVTAPKLSEVFSDWVDYGLFASVEGIGVLFGEYNEVLKGTFNIVMLVITYCLVDMFDTLGTLYGASAEAGMLDENGDPEKVGESMLCDSIGTVVGALTGTSTVTTFVESSAGVASGGRTGLTSVVTAILFLACLFVAPLAQYIPSSATAPALIYVGVLMCKNILKVDFTSLTSQATAFMTFIMMIATYSISNGIMVGAITYVLITLFTGKYSRKDIVVTVIALLGVLRFAFVTM